MTQQSREFGQLLAEERIMLRVTELIADQIKRRGMSRKQFADALGVSQAEITQRLSGRRNLTLRSVAAMLHALDTEVVVGVKHYDKDSGIKWTGE